MKLIRAGVSRYNSWVGKTFVCSKTGNEYMIEQSDIEKTVAGSGGKQISGVICLDCGRKVGFEHDQREGDYLSHD